MKKLIIITTALFSLTALSSDYIRLNGHYRFASIETAQVRDVELVPVSNKERFKELVADSYNCASLGQFYKCQKFLHHVELPADIKSEMAAKLKDTFYDFKTTAFEPSMTNEAESVKEWKFFDAVKSNEAEIAEYDYRLILGEQKTHKLLLKFPYEDITAIIESEKTFYTLATKKVLNSKLKTRVFELSQFYVK